MSNKVTDIRRREAAIQSLRPRPAFNARPVCAAGRESRSTEGPYATHYTSTASYLYINRLSGNDRFGKVPDGYVDRGDLLVSGRCHPQQKMVSRFLAGDALWREADEAAALEGPQAVSATHIVIDLPFEAPAERWVWLVENYAYRYLIDRGMIVDWAIHTRMDGDGAWISPPHAHLLATARFWRPGGRSGSRQRCWLANADQIRTAEDAWLQTLKVHHSVSA